MKIRPNNLPSPNKNEILQSWENQNNPETNIQSETVTENMGKSFELIVNTQIESPIRQENNHNYVHRHEDFLPKHTLKTVPSLMKPYKLLTTKPEISVRPYVLGKLKQLNISKLSTKQLFLEILKGIECNFDKLQITLSDFTYLSLQRRVLGFTSVEFNAQTECKVCGHVNKKSFNHKKLKFETLEVDLPVIIDFNGFDFYFTPFNMDDYFFLYDLDLLEDSIAFFAVQCRNDNIEINYPETKDGITLDEKTRRFYTIYQIFHDLYKEEDIEVLESLDTHLNHKLQPVEFACDGNINYKDEQGKEQVKKCDNKYKVTLDGGGVVITPFYEHTESIKRRVRFGFKADN